MRSVPGQSYPVLLGPRSVRTQSLNRKSGKGGGRRSKRHRAGARKRLSLQNKKFLKMYHHSLKYYVYRDKTKLL